MELKKVVGGGTVTHIAEVKYREFNGVSLTNDTVYKETKRRDPKSIRKDMIKGYMSLLSN